MGRAELLPFSWGLSNDAIAARHFSSQLKVFYAELPTGCQTLILWEAGFF
jgi:hypothetical protein